MQGCRISIANWGGWAVRFLVHDVMKWQHFPCYWPFVRGIHWLPVNAPHKSQWCGTFMFSLICTWINGWVNSGETGDLGCHHTHYHFTVMWWAPSVKRKDHHGVSSGWSSTLFNSNTGLSSAQYEQIPIIFGVWPFGLLFSVNNILTPGLNGLSKGNCKTGRESFKFWDLVQLILEILR